MATTEQYRTSYWPWSRTCLPEPQQITTSTSAPTPTETKKTVASKDLPSIVAWHFWSIVPCLAAVVILYLNLSGYVIGTEVGKSREGTGNILGMLQVVAKAYEVTAIVCLVNIVQQWIQWALIGSGTLFGLLCSEKSLGGVGFLNSKEYLAAIGYGFHGLFWWIDLDPGEKRQRQQVFFLSVFMALVCLLCAVVGPASAVLMIPELDWFFEGNRDWIPRNEQDVRSGSQCYPYILIDPRLGTGEYIPSRVDTVPISDYWRYTWYMKNPYGPESLRSLYAHQQHKFTDLGLSITINSTTTWNRPISPGANWTGGTRFTTGVRWDTRYMSSSLADYHPKPHNRGSKSQFVVDMSGIVADAVCRRRHKVPCNSGNSSAWCYMHATMDDNKGELLSSQDLLLMVDHSWGGDIDTVMLPRFWMSEGPRTTNRKFTDSIVFVFEDSIESPIPDPLLTVCSINATLHSVTAISPSIMFSADLLHFFDYLAYFTSTPHSPGPPQTFLYHENWLDMIHEDLVVPGRMPEAVMQHGNKTYLPRANLRATENTLLKPWAIGIQNADSYTGSPIWWPDESSNYTEAGEVELVVGGAYLSMLSRILKQSNSQYSMSFFPNDFSRAGKTQTYPEELMPEPMISCQYRYTPIRIYHEIYGYKSTSTAAILSMAVLITLLLIAISGSIWQCRKGAIIRAWSSIPEYATLCLGTNPELGGIESTCAGICSKETMKRFVKIRETTLDHLELIVSPFPTPENLNEVQPDKKYGFLGNRARKEGCT